MDETNDARLPWRTSILWVVAAMVAGFIGLLLGPKTLVMHRWWVDGPTDAPDDLMMGFIAIAASCFLASTLVLSLGNIVFPKSGTRPVLVSIFVTLGLFALVLALLALAVADVMRWI